MDANTTYEYRFPEVDKLSEKEGNEDIQIIQMAASHQESKIDELLNQIRAESELSNIIPPMKKEVVRQK